MVHGQSTHYKYSHDRVKYHSAVGPDKFPASILKECRLQLAPPLANLWRKSLDIGYIPEHFLSQSVIPVFKKGNKSLAVNYRPISLTSHIIKVFERVVRSRLKSAAATQTGVLKWCFPLFPGLLKTSFQSVKFLPPLMSFHTTLISSFSNFTLY